MTEKPRSVPDAEATPEIEAAMRQIDRLLPLAGAPVTVTSDRPEQRQLHNWDLAAPAMVFSATSCLYSLRWLATAPKARRTQDASTLLRRLFEHVVNFAWIAVNPSVNAPIWVADDFEHRLKADADLRTLGFAGLPDAQRADYRRFVDTHGTMPGLPVRADHADQFWSTRLEGHGTYPRRPSDSPTGLWSLRKLYAAIYRATSPTAHPTPMSIQDYVWRQGEANTFVIGMNTLEPIDRYGYTMAPATYAVLLLMAAQVLGRPSADDIYAAFDS